MLQECFYFLGLVAYFSGIGLPFPDGRKYHFLMYCHIPILYCLEKGI